MISSDVKKQLAVLQMVFDDQEETIAKLRKQQNLSEFEQFAEVIRAARKAQGLSQTQLAEFSGVGFSTINKIEQGNPNINLAKLLDVTTVLGVKLWIG